MASSFLDELITKKLIAEEKKNAEEIKQLHDNCDNNMISATCDYCGTKNIVYQSNYKHSQCKICNNKLSDRIYDYLYYRCPKCKFIIQVHIKTGINNAKCNICNIYPFNKILYLFEPKIIHYYVFCKHCMTLNRLSYYKDVSVTKCVSCKNTLYDNQNTEYPNCGELHSNYKRTRMQFKHTSRGVR